MHVVKTLSVTALAALLAATMLTPAGSADMTNERALNAAKEPHNWLLHYGNYEGHRFSALKDVNTGNVKNLKVAFTVPLSGYESGGRSQFGAMEATPIVEDGLMYVTDGWGRVYAIDVSTGTKGAVRWRFDPQIDRAWAADLIARVEASGYHAVVLTVDVQLYGRRERDIVNRFSPRDAMSHAPNPRGPDANYQERLTWDDVAWLKKTTRLPIGIKGIMTPRDAKRALDTGVELIWVSNHGGRQLDQTQGAIDALPPIVDAVAGQASIVVDGGFNRGTAVLKALALGATVVAVGRAALWGLAADGAAGVACALGILRRELRTAMGLSGQTSVKGLSPDLVFRVD